MPPFNTRIMRITVLFLLLIGMLLGACQPASAPATATIPAATATTAPAVQLVHLVYFQLQEKAPVDSLITTLKQLAQIPLVKNFRIGTFADLGDERALATYDVLLEMGFTDEAAYRAYQQHQLHLQVKAKLGAYLAGPPATYDYRVR